MPAGRGRGHRGRAQVRADDRPVPPTVRLLADGSVVVYAGTSDMGQGARTIFAQIAAQELGAPLDWVTVVMGDTAVVPYDQQTSASRSTVIMGNAVLDACRDIQAKIRSMAARLESVDEADDRRRARRGPDRRPRAADPGRPRSRGLGRLGGEVIGIGELRKEAEPDHPLGGTAAFFEFNCTAVEVEVDRETGDVTIDPARDRVRRGQGAQPDAGPRPGRGRRDHGPRPHADGAAHPRRRRAGSATSARSTTGSRRRMDLPLRDGERRSSRTATGPGRTARRA